MPKRRIDKDSKRSARYHSVINLLSAERAFQKSEVYQKLKDENPSFVGRIIGDLLRDGYLKKGGSRKEPDYSWVDTQEFSPGKWVNQRVLTPTVKRSPSSDRPRERLLRVGPSELKTSELLAILIRSGRRGESALQGAEKLAALFGSDLPKLSLQGRGELKQISKAIGDTAYCQIMAALELGKRLVGQPEKRANRGPRMRNTSDTLAFCRDHFMRLAQESQQEEFHVVLLDDKNRVIKPERITVGILNQALAHPREVFKPAIKESASAMILVHNHPNGDPTPSEDDKKITKELKEAAAVLGLRIIDHIIVSREKALSMVEERVF
jgi:DNA repair protein RadC